MNDNTNIWDALVILFYLVFILALFAGTTYMVQAYDWSMWTYLLTLFFVPKIRTGSFNKKKEPVKPKVVM